MSVKLRLLGHEPPSDYESYEHLTEESACIYNIDICIQLH